MWVHDRDSVHAGASRAAQPELRISVIVPTLNEAIGIEHMLLRMPHFVDEVIVVDGGSTDGTTEIARQVRPGTVVLRQHGRGKGDAIKTGLAAASGDIVVTMDGDGSMSPADIKPAIFALTSGADFVKGSRALPGGGSTDFTPVRWLGNWLLTRVASRVAGRRYTDITYGFNAYWRDALLDASSLSDGFEFEIQAAIRVARQGRRVAEVASYEAPRIGGESKLHPFRDGYLILRLILSEASIPRSHAPCVLSLDENYPTSVATAS